MITNQPWFAPRDYKGWGWRPSSWQGWLVMAAFVAVVTTGVLRFGPGFAALGIGLVSFAVLCGVIRLTGAKPGGPDLY